MKKKLFGLDKAQLQPPAAPEEAAVSDIAIIGMAVRLPQAADLDQLWELAAGGKDAIGEFPAERRKDAAHLAAPGQPLVWKPGAYLPDIAGFDYGFFGLTPSEAAQMDPHQRLWLQTAWTALEHAGYGGGELKGSDTGIYVGLNSTGSHRYAEYVRRQRPGAAGTALTGGMNAVIASRLAYLLDFHGPSYIVDTTCSSSLVAVHLACQGLIAGDCQLAVAGGVRLTLLPLLADSHAGIDSTDGRTKTFDAGSDGTGIGEGVAAVLLKPLRQARRDGDPVCAVIKGTAVNQDGRTVGLTAPSNEAQERVVRKAWQRAGIAPETVRYIEVHGTGTKLGDPVEIDGLQRAFRAYTDKKQFCALSTVKTNMGHLDSAAGIAGLVKAVLSLQHRQITPLAHFQSPNPNISFIDSPVYVNDELCEWERGDGPRRCGVSSFGLSGTNCHIVLEEASEADWPGIASVEGAGAAGELEEADQEQILALKENEPTGAGELDARTGGADAVDEPGEYVLPLSAKTAEGLVRLAAAYERLVSRTSGLHLADLVFTASVGRGHYSHRLAIVCGSRRELALRLRSAADVVAGGRVEGVTYGQTGARRAGREEAERAPDELQRMREEAQRLVERGREPGDAAAGQARELARLYANGADIPWAALFAGQHRRRVPLPTYPFAAARCWVEPAAVPGGEVEAAAAEAAAAAAAALDGAGAGDAGRGLRRVWRQAAAPAVGGARAAARRSGERGLGRALVIHGPSAEPGPLLAALRPWRERVGAVAADGSEEGRQRLRERLAELRPTQIVFAAALDEAAAKTPDTHAIEACLQSGVYETVSILPDVFGVNSPSEIDFVLLLRGAAAIEGDEGPIRPEQAALAALGRVIGSEYPQLRCRCFDIDGDPLSEEAYLADLTGGSRTLDYMTVYRRGRKYSEWLVPVEDEAQEQGKTGSIAGGIAVHPAAAGLVPAKAAGLRSNGVYVITGGLGGIGLEIAAWIAGQTPATIVLLHRSPFPPQERWTELLGAAGVAAADRTAADGKLRQRLLKLRQIAAAGAAVRLYEADVADEEQVAAALADVRLRCGAIHGVVHSAGVAGDGFLLRKSAADFRRVFDPKVRGALNVHRATKDDRLDFMLLFSSTTSMLGTPGQGDYAAANAFLERFAAWLRREGVPATAVQWPTWRETGMAVDYGVQDAEGPFLGLTTAEALNLLGLAMDHGAGLFVAAALNPAYFRRPGANLPLLLDERLKERLGRSAAGSVSDISRMETGAFVQAAGASQALVQSAGQTVGASHSPVQLTDQSAVASHSLAQSVIQSADASQSLMQPAVQSSGASHSPVQLIDQSAGASHLSVQSTDQTAVASQALVQSADQSAVASQSLIQSIDQSAGASHLSVQSTDQTAVASQALVQSTGQSAVASHLPVQPTDQTVGASHSPMQSTDQPANLNSSPSISHTMGQTLSPVFAAVNAAASGAGFAGAVLSGSVAGSAATNAAAGCAQLARLQPAALTGREAEPYSDEERFISSVWRDVLGFEELHVEDHFFAIGGDSLMLMRVHELLQARYGNLVSMTDLFVYPTIAELAAYVRSRSAKPEATAAVAAATVDHRTAERENRPERPAGKSTEHFLQLLEAIGSGALTTERALDQIRGTRG